MGVNSFFAADLKLPSEIEAPRDARRPQVLELRGRIACLRVAVKKAAQTLTRTYTAEQVYASAASLPGRQRVMA